MLEVHANVLAKIMLACEYKSQKLINTQCKAEADRNGIRFVMKQFDNLIQHISPSVCLSTRRCRLCCSVGSSAPHLLWGDRLWWLLKVGVALACFGLILKGHSVGIETAMRLVCLGTASLCILMRIKLRKDQTMAAKILNLVEQLKILEYRGREMEGKIYYFVLFSVFYCHFKLKGLMSRV